MYTAGPQGVGSDTRSQFRAVLSQRQKLSKNATSSILATVWRELIHLEWFRELHHSSEVLFLETPIELADQLSRHWEVLIL